MASVFCIFSRPACQRSTIWTREEDGVQVCDLDVGRCRIRHGRVGHRSQGETKLMDASLRILRAVCVPSAIRKTVQDRRVRLSLARLALPALLVQRNGTSEATDGIAILVASIAREESVPGKLFIDIRLAVARGHIDARGILRTSQQWGGDSMAKLCDGQQAQ